MVMGAGKTPQPDRAGLVPGGHREPGDESPTAIILIRFRAGVVGERERVTHIVPVEVDTPGPAPTVLTAYCGTEFRPGQAEQIDGIRGMPCEPCMWEISRLPLPATP
jgi:hypothetical protein